MGGLAVSARAEPRFTRDADVVVAVADDRDAESLVLALQSRGYRVEAAIEQEATGRLATVRLAPPTQTTIGVVVDLLFASSGIEEDIVAAAERIEILPALIMPVASLGHLIALKILSRDDRTRPQDLVDLVALLAKSDPTSVDVARHALGLIRQRGFDRGRDLAGDLDALLSGRG